MKRMLAIVAVVLAVTGLAFGNGVTNWQNSPQDLIGENRIQDYIDDFQLGSAGKISQFDSDGQYSEITISGDAALAVGGDLTITGVGGDFSVTDNLTVGDILITTPSSTAITNLEAIVITDTYMKFTVGGSGYAHSTCTFAVVSADLVGSIVVIENLNTDTNLIFVDNGATLSLSGTITLDDQDTLTLIVAATNEIRQLATSDN